MSVDEIGLAAGASGAAIYRHFSGIAHRELGSLWAHEHRALSGSYQRRLDRRTRLYVSQWVDVLERAFPDVPRKSLRSAALVTIGTTSSLVSRPGRAISARESAIVLQMLMAGLLSVCQD